MSSTATDYLVRICQFASQNSLRWYQTSPTYIHVWLTCLLAKTSSTASLSSSSFSIRLISSLASPIRSLSLLSTTNIRPGIDGGREGGREERWRKKREKGGREGGEGADEPERHTSSNRHNILVDSNTREHTILVHDIIGDKLAKRYELSYQATHYHIEQDNTYGHSSFQQA